MKASTSCPLAATSSKRRRFGRSHAMQKLQGSVRTKDGPVGKLCVTEIWTCRISVEGVVIVQQSSVVDPQTCLEIVGAHVLQAVLNLFK